MGCPYNTRLGYGIILTKEETTKVSAELEKLEEDSNIEWDIEVGEFEPYVHCS